MIPSFLKKHGIMLFIICLVVIPFIINNQYIFQIAIMCGIYCILTISLNILAGFTGQLSLGHVGFYAIGAYASTLLTLRLGVPVLIGFVAGALIAALFGFIVSFPAIRLSGVYLGIATLGFGEIVRLVATVWMSLTRGPMGLPGIPRPKLFGILINSNFRYYILILCLLFLIYLIAKNLTNSRIGLAFLAIREDEVAAASMGVNIIFYKSLAFIISAFFAGIAGAFLAHFISYISPANFMSGESFLIVSMYIVGGPASLIGSMFGAILLTLANEVFRFMQGYRQVFYAMLLVLVILFKPEGLSGILKINKVTSGLPKKESDLVLGAKNQDLAK